MNVKKRPYEDFVLVPETDTGGWRFGAITVYGRAGCICIPGDSVTGDGFVEAPDGSRAGIVWTVGEFEPFRIGAPDEERWGIFEVPFARPVETTDDLVYCFRKILPYLQHEHDAALRLTD